ncbi:MAG: hypothetical protein GX259_09565 [Bacteroidales bacterium]|nr:hypothetical protein [Bacteroidales bacterium]
MNKLIFAFQDKVKSTFLTFLSIVVLTTSCSKDEYSDFSNPYIVFKSSNEIKLTDLTVSSDTSFYFFVKSQSDIQSVPKIYKRVNNGEKFLINNLPESRILTETYGSGRREVRKILLDLNHIEYSEAQTIEYFVTINTKKGLKSSTLLIRVE